MAVVIGRAAELDAIERFLAALADGPVALVLEGEAGIGKTTLMRAGSEAARGHGARVLSCAPSAPEVSLAYAGLSDLLAEIDSDLVRRLPRPQRNALDAALLRSLPGATGVDQRAVATAALSLLEALAEEGHVVVAIDDMQWLDGPSARVVGFCARRLVGGVGLLASRRVGERRAWEEEPKLREPDRMDVRQLAPLSVRELELVLRERAPHKSFAHRALARVHGASGGNPFYALEIARILPVDGLASPALPLPASLDEIVAARLAGLGEDVEELLLVVAALAEPTVERVERALARNVGALLDEAERRGVLKVDGERLRFTHPLLASCVYARAPSGRRRALHRRLSAVVCDMEERARHLAHAGVAVEAVAALDEAAGNARARGAPDAAAELLELAIDLGGGQDLRVRAAEHHFDAGDARRARALVAQAIKALPSGRTRARALLLLSDIRCHDDSYPEARELLERARAELGPDMRLQVEIDGRLAFICFNLGLVDESAAAARSALARAEQVGDPAVLAQALAASVITDFCLGRGLDDARLARALELEDRTMRAAGELRPSQIASVLFRWTGRFDEARAALVGLANDCADQGNEHDLAWLNFWRVSLECSAGNLESASALAEEAVERLLRLDTRNGRGLALATRARVDAYTGRAELARRAANEALTLFENADWRLGTRWARMILGFLDLSVGDHEAAAARLAPLAAVSASGALAEPTTGDMLFHGDVAEAFIAVGRIEEAERIVSWLEERGAALDRSWAIAIGLRGRGLLLSAGGEVAAAERTLERALVAHERLPMPIERARTLLVLGRIRRRLRKRRAAKAVFTEALEIFEAVGSPLWAAQARAEIACIGLRPRMVDDLTPSEERVAALAAAGHTNREVADTLLVSAKTVEAHLARAYRKLGIHSRAQLGAEMTQRHGRGAPVATARSR